MAPKPAAPTATYTVTLKPEAAGGRRAVGDMLPGREYPVPAAEAVRLVKTKGFTLVGATLADAEKTAEAERIAAEKAAAELAATTAATAATTPEV
jgi:hypothetical protein